MPDWIHIDGFVGHTVIGIHDSELHRRQPIRIDLKAAVGRSLAGHTDRIEDTIDYGTVVARLRRLMDEHRVQLLEALAETIAVMLIEEFGARSVALRIVKPAKFDDVDAVGISIERHAHGVPD